MKGKEFIDWKDVADSYFEKAISLAVLLVLFAFLVFPKMEVPAYERNEQEETIAIQDIPDIKDIVKPPSQIKKPKINIVVDEDLDGGDDEELELLDTIEQTDYDPFEEVEEESNEVGKTNKFATYEEAPVMIQRLDVEYPKFAKEAGIEGTVILQVEVFADGSVGAVEIIKSVQDALDQAAINAIKKVKFKPATNNGQPVAVWITLPIELTLN